jgi:N4-gp56 family major capsid protein
MPDVATTFATISSDAPNVYIGRQMYQLAEKKMALGQFARKYELPQRNSKTLRVVRYKRLALPTATLTEGTPPDAVALAVENVDVTVEQWGIVVLLTDVGLITTVHPALQIAIERTSLAMVEVLEREMAETLLGGSAVVFPGAVTTRAGLVAGNVMATETILKATTQLRALGAADFDGGLYGGVISPQSEADMLAADTVFRTVESFAHVRRFEVGEIGVYGGTRWVRGNFLPILKGVAAPDGAAATAEKAQVAIVNGGGALAQGNYKVRIVARDLNTDYERKISQDSGNFAADAGNDDRLSVTFPSSANYVYDVYMTQVGGAVFFLKASRQAASSVLLISTQPAGNEATAPAPPASGVEVYIAWVFGKDGFGRVELNGMSLQAYLTPPGASWSNPLAQGRKCGAKIAWKCFIIDNAFFVRIETGSAYPSQLPA